jgi:hypothetical protein
MSGLEIAVLHKAGVSSEKRPGTFAIVPLRAAQASLAARDYKVLIAIAYFANPRGYAWPGMSTIARLAVIDRTKVPGSIRKLEAAELLIREGRSQKGTTLYRLLFGAAVLPKSATADSLVKESPKTPTEGVANAGNGEFRETGTQGVPNAGNGEFPQTATEDVANAGNGQLPEATAEGVTNPGNQTDQYRTDHRTGRDAPNRRGDILTHYEPGPTTVAWVHENCPWIPDAADPTLIAGFRDYYAARGITFKDPDAAFRRWCTKAKDFGSRAPSCDQSTLIETALNEIKKGWAK